MNRVYIVINITNMLDIQVFKNVTALCKELNINRSTYYNKVKSKGYLILDVYLVKEVRV